MSLRRWYWILQAQLGFDPRRTLRTFCNLSWFISDFIRFRKVYAGRLEVVPCLHDRRAEAGATKDEYFWQDLWVARQVHAAKPERHVDVGSRVDGFVAHIAAFREIEVFDIRPISARIPGVKFRRADLMSHEAELDGYCDSVSCLHALEHFGLGRYGDPVNPKGHELGLRSIARLLKDHGCLYLSVPLGI